VYYLSLEFLMGRSMQNALLNMDLEDNYNVALKELGFALEDLYEQEKDAALGEDLMKKRIKTKKVRSERVFGKDSPEFEKYRQMNPSELETKYGISMQETEEGIKVTREITVNAETGAEIKTDEDGVPFDALEVPITSINAETGESTQTRFFTAAQG
jgi:hypothetical protein